MIEIAEKTSIGYGRTVVAVTQCPLRFDDRGLTFLAGKNGEGKTTFMKYLCGCLDMRPDFRARTIYLPEELDFGGEMTGRQIGHAVLSRRDARETFKSLAATVSLDLRKPYRHLSKGNKQKLRNVLVLARAQDTEANLVCLDEAMSGLDYAIRREFWTIFAEEAERRHVILSLHLDQILTTASQVIGVASRSIFKIDGVPSEWGAIEEALESCTGLPNTKK